MSKTVKKTNVKNVVEDDVDKKQKIARLMDDDWRNNRDTSVPVRLIKIRAVVPSDAIVKFSWMPVRLLKKVDEDAVVSSDAIVKDEDAVVSSDAIVEEQKTKKVMKEESKEFGEKHGSWTSAASGRPVDTAALGSGARSTGTAAPVYARGRESTWIPSEMRRERVKKVMATRRSREVGGRALPNEEPKMKKVVRMRWTREVGGRSAGTAESPRGARPAGPVAAGNDRVDRVVETVVNEDDVKKNVGFGVTVKLKPWLMMMVAG
jgi:hypothetical protein